MKRKPTLYKYNKVIETKALLAIDEAIHEMVIEAIYGDICEREFIIKYAKANKHQLKNFLCEYIDRQFDSIFNARFNQSDSNSTVKSNQEITDSISKAVRQAAESAMQADCDESETNEN